ncbi:MAG: hypothetical protein AABW59_05185 [archaeon]
MKKGFVFSLEAALALVVIASAIIFLPQVESVTLDELMILQQENDLLKVWSYDPPSDIEAMADCTTMFGNNYSLTIDGRELVKKPCAKRAVASEARIVNELLLEQTFKIEVCFSG